MSKVSAIFAELEHEKCLPAVDVKQNAMPARHDDATVPNTPANGIESSAPMVRKMRVENQMSQQCCESQLLMGAY